MTRGRTRLHTTALFACFLLSGVAGLIYQAVWSQRFVLIFGAAQPAIAAVLAATMAGLALGAVGAARWGGRTRRPLALYGGLEIGIAITAALVPAGLRLVGALQEPLLAGTSGPSARALVFDLAASFLLLGPPTMLMGATLPLLARYVVRHEHEIGPGIAALYAINTLGAAGGAALAAFALIPRYGLTGATTTAIALNLGVGVLALFLDRPRRGVSQPPETIAPGRRATGSAWVQPAILVSGFVAFSHEVLWTRLFTHVLGSSVYAFGTMLATVLLGLALGAAAARPWSRETGPARRAFAVCQLAIAVLSVIAFALTDRLPSWLAADGSTLPAPVLAALLLLPATAASGAAFPLAVRLRAAAPDQAASASAQVFAWNTIGTIAGAILTGFWLLPKLGFVGLIAATASASLLLAAVSAWGVRPRLRRIGSATVGAMILLALLPPSPPERLLGRSLLALPRGTAVSTTTWVGRSATVALTDTGGSWRLTTDGLPEATILAPGARRGRYPVVRWLSLLPLTARPSVRSMLVVGLGGGLTVERLPDQLETVQVVELEPEVVAANRLIGDRRADDPLTDPRVTMVIDDARSALRLDRRAWDAIVSQPSHPWTAGASHLYTRSFFELVASRLGEDGVFVQWIGLETMSVPLLQTLIATLGDVFPHLEVFRPEPGTAAVFLASKRAIDFPARAAETFDEHRGAWRDLGIVSVSDLLAARLLDDAGARAFAGDAPRNTDGHNLLRARAPRLLGHPLSALDLARAVRVHDPLPRDTPGIDRLAVVARLAATGSPWRARRVAAASPEPSRRAIGQALVDLTLDRAARGRTVLAQAAARAPEDQDAVHALTRLSRTALTEGRIPPVLARALPLHDAARAVVRGWQLLDTDQPRAIHGLETRLASIPPGDLLYGAASRLRIAWRAASDASPGTGHEALALLDPLLAVRASPRDLLLRAQLGLVAERTDVALGSLEELVERTATRGLHPALTERAKKLMEAIAARPHDEDRRRALQVRIERSNTP